MFGNLFGFKPTEEVKENEKALNQEKSKPENRGNGHRNKNRNGTGNRHVENVMIPMITNGPNTRMEGLNAFTNGRDNGNRNATGRENGNGPPWPPLGGQADHRGRRSSSSSAGEIESSEGNVESGFVQEALSIPQNLEILTNKEKFHFFIGSILNKDDVTPLIQVRKQLEGNPQLKNKRWNMYHTRYIYLGYIDKRVAKMMMEKIFHPLCQALANRYAPFTCNYDKLVFRGKQRKNKIISLQYHDEQNKIHKVLIPYLREAGLKMLYSIEPSQVEPPHIDLIYYNLDEGVRTSNVYNRISREVPSGTFRIDNLCLIKGDPFRGGGSGVPSKYDRLQIECVEGFQYNLHGSV